MNFLTQQNNDKAFNENSQTNIILNKEYTTPHTVHHSNNISQVLYEKYKVKVKEDFNYVTH